jgi:hypothetical protein
MTLEYNVYQRTYKNIKKLKLTRMQYKFVYQKIKNEKNIYVLSALLDVVDGQ